MFNESDLIVKYFVSLLLTAPWSLLAAALFLLGWKKKDRYYYFQAANFLLAFTFTRALIMQRDAVSLIGLILVFLSIFILAKTMERPTEEEYIDDEDLWEEEN